MCGVALCFLRVSQGLVDCQGVDLTRVSFLSTGWPESHNRIQCQVTRVLVWSWVQRGLGWGFCPGFSASVSQSPDESRPECVLNLMVSPEGRDGHSGLGRGPGLSGAAHQQPPKPPQRHRRLPLAAGQDQGRPGTTWLGRELRGGSGAVLGGGAGVATELSWGTRGLAQSCPGDPGGVLELSWGALEVSTGLS